MDGKITLITPPDIFENDNFSLLFVHLTDDDQLQVSKWLADRQFNDHVNIYFYDKEADTPWLLHSFNKCEFRFIDLNNLTHQTDLLAGYLLGKGNTFYKIENETTASVCGYINNNRLSNVQTFLEKAFDEQDRKRSHL
jgi:hypothetical protein